MHNHRWLILCLNLFSFSFAINLTIDTAGEVVADLRGRLSVGSQIIVTEDPLYQKEFTQRWSVYDNFNPHYLVAAQPRTVQDVQKIVQYVASNRIPFLATGGGHGYTTTLSRLRNGLNLDLSKFRSVSVNRTASLMTIGAATTFADIFDPLYAAGKQFPNSGSSSPGILGVALGGGIGPYTGVHGLASDALRSAEIVTGSGEIVTVSASKNADLFWGLQGAGHNFGVVTSATFAVYDAINDNQAINADMVFSASANRSIFTIFKELQNTQDPRLSLLVASSLKETTPVIGINAIFFGPKAEGLKAFKPFLDLSPTTLEITAVPAYNLTYTTNFGADSFARTKGINVDLWGYQLNDLNIAVLERTFSDLMQFGTSNPTIGASAAWVLEMYSRFKATSIPDNSTAYPWRDTIAYGVFDFNLPNDVTPQLQTKVDNFASDLRQRLSRGCGNPQSNIYVNFARGTESPEQIYGAKKLQKLQQLKARWDPQNVFNNYNSFTR